MPPSPEIPAELEPGRHHYWFAAQLPALTSADVERLAPTLPPADYRTLTAIQPQKLTLNAGTFTSPSSFGGPPFPPVTVEQQPQGLLLTCSCSAPAGTLCEHQALVLLSILQRKELRVFFDAAQRQELLRAAARDYGLEHATDLDAHFELTYNRPQVLVAPRQAGLFAVTAATTQELVSQLLPEGRGAVAAAGSRRIVVLSRHKYYGHLTVQLAEAVLTTAGKVKNPVTVLNPLDRLGTSDNLAELRFYSGLARFQHNYDEKRSTATLQALRAIVDNPENLPVFAHNPTVSDKLTGPALTPLQLRAAPPICICTSVSKTSFTR
ncbi:hypothetical protein [Hymenobacter cellulosilyticus]|uniref:SWIM-type domain-containing protein n=1 Tax=Hymenobacter cellulosilyticus TaxID=2932248 RepID=A0A8T9Q0Q4_9BACT|nr:hypothetical protein [Hymenobacter cellulosilyticus]UOQ69981.1 hypothetical protein MUN79_14390 [Hymenobacter cellulosilyticus]